MEELTHWMMQAQEGEGAVLYGFVGDPDEGDEERPGAVAEMRLSAKGLQDLAEALLAAAETGHYAEWAGRADAR